MDLTQALLGEHGVFYAQFDQLEKTASSGTLTDVQAQADLIAVALLGHAGLEDDLLFTALEPQLGTQAGPLAVMRMDHIEIEGAFERIARASDLAEARGLVREALQTLRGHFAKEEQVLFPMAAQVLGSGRLVEMGGRWADTRKVWIGRQ